MCLAVPVQITKIVDENTLEVSLGEGSVVQVASTLLPEPAKIGDYTIIHAGFALRILDVHEAKETLKLFEQMAMSLE